MTDSNASFSNASFKSQASRASAWTLPLSNLVNWTKNNNRIEIGEIETLAKNIVKNGQNSPVVGFWKDGVFHVTDGCRRMEAFNFIVENPDQFPGYTLPKILVKLADKEATDYDHLSSQITSETLPKSPYERMVIVGLMSQAQTREGKLPTQEMIADSLGVSIATVSNYLTVYNHAPDEVKLKISTGELTVYDAVATLVNAKKEAKALAKANSGITAEAKAPKVEADEFRKSKSATPKNQFTALATELLSDTVPSIDGQTVRLALDKAQYDRLIELMGQF